MSDQTNTDPNSVFSEGQPKQQQQEHVDQNQERTDPQRTDEVLKNSADQAGLSSLVGEGKKYSSVEKALEALEHSQSFIDQLKEENRGLREELTATERMEEALRRIETSRGEGAVPSEQGGKGADAETPQTGAGQDDGKKFTQEEISELVRGEVTRIERQRTAEQNEMEASNKLVELAGGDQKDATAMVQKAAEELGVSVRYLRQQAQTSPTAFYRLVSASAKSGGDSGGPNVMKSDSGSQNTEAFNKNQFRSGDSEIQPYSHFKKLRKTLSKSEYYSPSVQNAMMRSRQQLGDSFYDA